MQQLTRHIYSELEESWKLLLADQFSSDYFLLLESFLNKENEGYPVFPPEGLIFRAFEATPFSKVKVVILGQDPYHGVGQAHGLSFSVPQGVKAPPSLRNIFKELKSDFGAVPLTNDLMPWAEQGVLLLNSILTVRSGNPGSHQNRGWEQFTDRVVQVISDQREHVVFMLWGSYAQVKGRMIDRQRHLVIESPHPSPFSAHRGFFGSKPFSQANEYLTKHGQEPICWA